MATTRPWAIVNDQHKSEAIRLLGMGLSVHATAARLGRTATTLWDWIQADPAFAQAVNALRADREDEMLEFRQRVRRAAGEQLDHLMQLADPTRTVNAAENNKAIRTFFESVHNPIFAPRSVAAAAQPVIMVGAEQAVFLFGGGDAAQMAGRRAEAGEGRAVVVAAGAEGANAAGATEATVETAGVPAGHGASARGGVERPHGGGG